MTTLRVGTRGSDLALWQTRWVADRLRAAHPSLKIEEVIIQTHGDLAKEQRFDTDWPVGGFVGAIERELAERRVDFAVHSYKDMQTAQTEGLTIAAVPGREVVHDVLVTRKPFDLANVPSGFKLGTSSPRRSAQFLRLSNAAKIVPIRGNVPTRVAKLETEGLDGVVLAAAGLKRLGIEVPYGTDLPTDQFVPSPAQGALAIQTRAGDKAEEIVGVLDEADARRCVEAERSFLSAINAGCHTPVGALAVLDGAGVSLMAQLFSDDGEHVVEGVERGEDPTAVGSCLAGTLVRRLRDGA